MPGRILIVHADPRTLAEVKGSLSGQVEADTAATMGEVARRLKEGDPGVILLDAGHPDLVAGPLLDHLMSAAPDAVIVMLGGTEERVRALDELMPGRIFRFFGGQGEWLQMAGMVREALRLHRLERERAELVKKLYGEYARLQKREKLLDVVVRERTRDLELAYERLQAAARQAILGFAEAIEAKDAYTKGHCGRVALYSITLAREAGMSEEDVRQMEFGAFLHDIGKIGVRDAVLLKPGPLDEPEWLHMRIHPLVGCQIASQIELLKPMVPCVRNHHERWDGNGYPDRLGGEDIPLSARIVCLADAYDAMATDRPYKRAMSLEECDLVLRKQAGVQFDPNLVEIFRSRGIAGMFAGSSLAARPPEEPVAKERA